MNPIRKKRLESQIRKVISDIFTNKVQDFDIGYVTFTQCELNKDFSQVKVFFSIFPNDSNTMQIAYRKLIKLQKFFQYHLASQLEIRNVPSIFFNANK